MSRETRHTRSSSERHKPYILIHATKYRRVSRETRIMSSSSSSAVLQLLRRLESQHVWRATTGGGAATLSTGGHVIASQPFTSDATSSRSSFEDKVAAHVHGWNEGGHLGTNPEWGQTNLPRISSRTALHTPHHQHGMVSGRKDGSIVHENVFHPRGLMNAFIHSSRGGLEVGDQSLSDADGSRSSTGIHWFDDESVSVSEALETLVQRIKETGPIKQKQLQLLYSKCTDASDLEKALGLTRLNYLARGELHQHDPFSHKTSSSLLQHAMRIGALNIAKRVLLQSAQFGLSSPTARQFNHVLIYYSKQHDLRSMLEMYELMKKTGPPPDSETCFIVVKGSVDCGRPDIANAVIAEFEMAGVRVRDGARLYVEQHV